MSAGRKVTVTLTQAEAEWLLRASNDADHHIPSPAEEKIICRARQKLYHQLDAVRGKGVTA